MVKTQKVFRQPTRRSSRVTKKSNTPKALLHLLRIQAKRTRILVAMRMMIQMKSLATNRTRTRKSPLYHRKFYYIEKVISHDTRTMASGESMRNHEHQ